MDVDKILELAECYIHQLSQHEKLPDEIKSIIKDPLPGRQVTPCMPTQSHIKRCTVIRS